MPDSALYYPYINVPDSGALNGILLYWDQLGAIVPRPVSPDRFTRELIAAGLVSAIAPQDFIGRSDPDFVDEFLNQLDVLPRLWEPAPPIFLHVEKGSEHLWTGLRERGLITRPPSSARRGPNASGWFCVEGRAGALYMAQLAVWLGSMPQIAMEPITDCAQMFGAMTGTPASGYERFNSIRSAVLGDVLPAPTGFLSPSDLAAFKESHRELLRLFRRSVEALVLRCAQETDAELRRRLVHETQIQLRDAQEEVERKLSERRWPTVRGTVCALVAGAPGLASGVAAHEVALGVTAGVAPLVIDYVRAKLGDRPSDPPFATYAVLAHRQFGL